MNKQTTNDLQRNKYEGICKRIGICVIIQVMTLFNLAAAGSVNEASVLTP